MQYSEAQRQWERQEAVRRGRDAAEQFREMLPVLSKDEIIQFQ